MFRREARLSWNTQARKEGCTLLSCSETLVNPFDMHFLGLLALLREREKHRISRTFPKGFKQSPIPLVHYDNSFAFSHLGHSFIFAHGQIG